MLVAAIVYSAIAGMVYVYLRKTAGHPGADDAIMSDLAYALLWPGMLVALAGIALWLFFCSGNDAGSKVGS